MKRCKRPLALLTSCMLLTNGVCTDMPFSRHQPAETKTLREFAAQLTQASDAAPHRELFRTLRFSGREQQLYRDGEPVGQSYAGYRIENGRLVISTDGQNALTPQEAAAQIGCCVLEQDGDLTVTFPFQTAKLIVKAEHEPALHGGRLLASGFQNLYVVQFESQEAAYRAYQAYQQDPDVEFADCDSVLSAAELPGSGTNALDSERTSWGVHDIGADDYCAWLTETKETLPEVCVAVVDTGVNAAHSWLNGRILPNGARFSEDAPGGWEDDFGHGTHCAGIIASCTMDNVKILPIKVLNREGMGTTLEVYCGVMYALEQGADVISMSLGGLGISPLLNTAAAAASEQDVTFCVAAGNESIDAKYTDVASAPDVIAVLGKNIFEPERFDPISYESLITELCIRDAEGEEIPAVSASDQTAQQAAMTAMPEAGQTYSVTVQAETQKDSEQFILGVEQERCPLAETKVYFEETVYAGDAEQPAPRLWNGTEQLKER
ncbi:MAG: S8 family serine peptidase [Oscillospiraceae bacterium]|nr:S8 family serine peptidase [Oscillospiraceae bacterium]